MGIQIGNSEVTNIQVGNTPVTAVYAGSTLIWPVESWSTVWEGDIAYRNTTSTSYPKPNKSGIIYTTGGSSSGGSIPAGIFTPGGRYRLYLGPYDVEVRGSQTVDYKSYYWYYYFSSSATTEDYIEIEFPEIPASGQAHNQHDVNIPSKDRTDVYISQVGTYVNSNGAIWLSIGGYYYYNAGYSGNVIAPALRITKITQLI